MYEHFSQICDFFFKKWLEQNFIFKQIYGINFDEFSVIPN